MRMGKSKGPSGLDFTDWLLILAGAIAGWKIVETVEAERLRNRTSHRRCDECAALMPTGADRCSACGAPRAEDEVRRRVG